MVTRSPAQTSESADEKTGEITTVHNRPDDAALQALTTVADIQSLMGAEGLDSADLGSGFALLNNKALLVGKPCMFLFWEINDGKFNEDGFVTAHVVTLDPQGNITGKYIVNDGSTGMAEQLRALGAHRRNLYARHGLRQSDYTVTGDDGKEKAATTFYIDTSA